MRIWTHLCVIVRDWRSLLPITQRSHRCSSHTAFFLAIKPLLISPTATDPVYDESPRELTLEQTTILNRETGLQSSAILVIYCVSGAECPNKTLTLKYLS